MENPFESFDKRLESIEDKLANLISKLESGKSTNSITWVTTKQLAQHLGVSTATVTKMRGTRIPYYKLSGKILFKREEIDELIENTRHKTGAENLEEYLSRNLGS
jgi:excisionase family DNA binding protein